MQETGVRSLGQEDPLEEGNGNPLQYSCLENPMDRGTWRATVHRIAELNVTERLSWHTLGETACEYRMRRTVGGLLGRSTTLQSLLFTSLPCEKYTHPLIRLSDVSSSNYLGLELRMSPLRMTSNQPCCSLHSLLLLLILPNPAERSNRISASPWNFPSWIPHLP